MTKYVLLFLAIGIVSCGGKADNAKNVSDKESMETSGIEEVKSDDGLGIGPVKSLELGEIDPDLAANGKEIFKLKCSSCHKMKKRFVGPGMKDITKKRKPEWIMNMILNPEEMVKEDPQAKALLAEYLAPMANQSLKQEEARAILEYFRKYDNK
jgi:mono/diheme cytochrome c family protein